MRDLEKLAADIRADNPPYSLIEDSISVCKYVSDEFGIELTIAQGERLFRMVR